MTWDFPLAWGLLGIAPLVWWWHFHRSKEAPILLGSIELWSAKICNKKEYLPSSVRRWDAILWLKILLLVLLTIAAAAPQWKQIKPSKETGGFAKIVLGDCVADDATIAWTVLLQTKEPSNSETTRLVIRNEGKIADVRLWNKAKSEERWVSGTLPRNQGGKLSFSLENERGKTIQNIQLPVPPAMNRQAIIIGSSGAWFMEQAILALPGWRIEKMNADMAVEKLSKETVNEFVVVFVMNVLSSERGAALLKYAPVWFWSSGPAGQGKILDIPVATEQIPSHPVLRTLDFSWITILEAKEPLIGNTPHHKVETLVASKNGGLLLAGDKIESPPRAHSSWPHRWQGVWLEAL